MNKLNEIYFLIKFDKMSKLDNNSKMIVSKYLIGKDFTNYIDAFKIQDYYHTTFNYIVIDLIHSYYNKSSISNSAIKRIKNNLSKFSNLNEIILNIVVDLENIDSNNLLYEVKYYYSKFKDTFKNIKFNILTKNYIPYKEIYIDLINDDIIEFLKNIFIPNVKQKVYIYFYGLWYRTDLSILSKYKNYDILIDLLHVKINKLNILNKLKDYKIYYTIYDDYYFRLTNLNDIEKYFVIKDNVIYGIKPRYNKTIRYIDNIELYSQIFKLKHTNLNNLNNFITNADSIIDEINNSKCGHGCHNNLKVYNMYKYGVKNIYSEDVLDNDTIYDILNLNDYIKNVNIIVQLKCRKVNMSYYYYSDLFKEIELYVRY